MTEFIKYAQIANLYDTYVQTTLDVPFFLNETRETSGEVLELMSGTGRVSLPLAAAGVKLTCVDISAEMLAILQEKLEKQKLTASIHQMNVCDLNLGKQFELVILPFHSFAEILSPQAQSLTLKRIFEHVAPGGRFICTLHNPVVRAKSVDGQLRLWGKYPLQKNHGTLLFWGLQDYESNRRIVNALEFFEEFSADGILRNKRFLELRFCLIGKEEFEGLATAAGFTITALYGDYAYSEFQAATSPFMIWKLQKP